MAEIRRHQILVHLVVIALWNELVVGFDSYGRRFNPNDQIYEATERFYNRDSFASNNHNPSNSYRFSQPFETSRRAGFKRRGESSFGNGYDNLGNGDFAIRFDSPWDRSRSSYNMRGNTQTFSENRRFDEPRTFRGYDKMILSDDRRESLRDRDFSNSERERIGSSRGELRYGENFGESNFDQPIDYFRDETPDYRDKAQPRFSPLDERRQKHSEVRLTRPNLTRRSHPPFYRRDYFVTKPAAKTSFESKNADQDYQSAKGEKENSGLSAVGSYVSNSEDKNQKRADSGFLENKDGARMDVESREKIGETTRFDKNGGNKSTAQSNRVMKKGHSTKGYATHHHKDETGNTTTFFDESSDHGGQSDYKDLEDEFDTRRTMEVLNGKEDGRFFRENGGRSGQFGSGFLKDNKKTEKDIVAKDDRFNSEEIFGAGKDHIDRGFKEAAEYLGGGVWDDSHHY